MIEIWTDGSCNNNPNHNTHGYGGWAYIILYNKCIVKEVSGREKNTTSQRMEQQAVISSLQFLKNNFKGYDFNVEIYSDSSYIVNCFKEKWYEKWELIDWIGIKNQDLWCKLLQEIKYFEKRINFNLIKGHSGLIFNERADKLAGLARKSFFNG